MKSKLLFNNHFYTISQYFARSNNYIYIITPFINTATLTAILSGVAHNDIIILTSWKKEHLLSGVSSLDIYPECVKNKWALYINDKIHAKIYSDGLKNGYVGSSNCTISGLRNQQNSNIECLTFVQDFDHIDRTEIQRILLSSTLVDDDIFSKYTEWIDNKQIIRPEFDIEMIYTDSRFFTSQLPATPSPNILWEIITDPSIFDENSMMLAEHDVALFNIEWNNENYEEFISKLKEAFFSNPFIIKFEENIQDLIFFGEATAWVHNICCDDPAPYRKEIKKLVENLFEWFVILGEDRFTIDIPGKHSQCLRKMLK